jgi:hypothetical protein
MRTSSGHEILTRAVATLAGGGLLLATTLRAAEPTPIPPTISAAEDREMSTDRPDVTESPFTVPPGRWQVEADLVGFARDRADGFDVRSWSAGDFNLRFGVSGSTEVGIFVAPWQRVITRAPGGLRESVSGFGDMTLRGKVNFAGNEGASWGSGVIADLKLPTARRGLGNDAVEGALTLPVARELGGGWDFGAMTRLELRRRTEGRGYRAVSVNTATVGRELRPNWGSYIELTSETGDGPHVATFDVGLTYRMTANLQLDGGANIGLTRAADDLQLFTGFSRRF